MIDQELMRKQKLKHKIGVLATDTANELSEEPRTKEEANKFVERRIYVINIRQLKEFVDRDCKGEPLDIIVSSPYRGEDRFYRAEYGETPDYEQIVFDTLKKYDLVSEDSQLSDYT